MNRTCSRFTWTFALATTLLLSGCGFHLRGSVPTENLPFKSIYLAFPETSTLGNELRRNIRGGGEITVTKTAAEAEAILDVLSETREKVILSLNSQGRVREYALYYRVTVRVKDNKNVELLPPTPIVLKRDISFNESQVLAKESEEALLYRDMQSDLVQQILRRILAIKRQVADNATAS